MSKEARPLVEMQRVAVDIVTVLEPYCLRIEEAGSVRRQKPLCADLELVAIPRMVPDGLFGDRQTSALHAYLKTQLVVFLKGGNPEARYHQLQLPDGLQVDLFLAQPDNWGWIYLLRTGSADFSQAVLTRWKRLQGIPVTQKGSIDGRLVHRDGSPLATPEEQDVFNAVHLPWIEPMQRNEALQ